MYIENSKDFYHDRRVKLHCVKSIKCFDLKRVLQHYKDPEKNEK